LGRNFDVIGTVLSGSRERTTLSIFVGFVNLNGIGVGFIGILIYSSRTS
jgi:hypothetical protein